MGNESSTSKHHHTHHNSHHHNMKKKSKKKNKTLLRGEEGKGEEDLTNGDLRHHPKQTFERNTIRRSFEKRPPKFRPEDTTRKRYSADNLPVIIIRKDSYSISTISSVDAAYNSKHKDTFKNISTESAPPPVSNHPKNSNNNTYKISTVSSASADEYHQNGHVPDVGPDIPTASRSMDTLSLRRSRFKDLRYQSVRGTSSEPKCRTQALKNENSTSETNKSTCSLTTKQVIAEEEFEKLKSSKKGRRIADIINTQGELFDLYKINENKKLTLTLNPNFDVTQNENEITCYSCDVNFLKIPNNKIEEYRSIYEVHITFSEAKFRADRGANTKWTIAERLLKAHTFVGRSHTVVMTGENMKINGNFYNPEFGKMDFFQFELIIYPIHIRDPGFCDHDVTDSGNNSMDSDTSNNNNNNNNNDHGNSVDKTAKATNINEFLKPDDSSQKAFIRRFREIEWGEFTMTLKGSFSSKEFHWTATERPTVEGIERTPEIKRKMF